MRAGRGYFRRPRALHQPGLLLCPPADALLAELAKNPGLSLFPCRSIIGTISAGRTRWLRMPSPSVSRIMPRRAAMGKFIRRRWLSTASPMSSAATSPRSSRRCGLWPGNRVFFRCRCMSAEVNGDLVGDVGAAGEGVPKWGSILLLQIAKKRVVTIGRGENAGHTYTYTNVVRSIVRSACGTDRRCDSKFPRPKSRLAATAMSCFCNPGNPTGRAPFSPPSRVPASDRSALAEKPSRRFSRTTTTSRRLSRIHPPASEIRGGAANRLSKAENVKAKTSPCLNGPDNRPGKKVCPVNVAAASGGNPASTFAGISSCIGL